MKHLITRVTLSFLVLGSALAADAQESVFEDPVFLKIGDEPMNADGGMMYPSPVLVDVDNDEVEELVIGTIFGGVYVAENSDPKAGLPNWEKPSTLKTKGGKPLKLNNW